MKMNFEKLFGVSREKISLFCLLGAERVAGIYAEYCKKYALSVDFNSSALAELFQRYVLLDKHELKLLYQEVYSGIPDTEDYSDELVDQAQCAVICTSYCVEYLENSSHESVRYAIAKVAEAIDILDEDVDRKTALEVDWCDQLLDVLIEMDLGDVQKIKDIRQKNLLHEVPVLGV
ncbi:hypothetical protein [Pseudomonas sp. KCJK9044]|uniref:hypothetical protein n=1 Tax=Pseudomonas sp. KCJK9044 TaxID=3344562 RepID=UPI003906987B